MGKSRPRDHALAGDGSSRVLDLRSRGPTAVSACSTRTCSAMPAGSCSPTMATTRAPCNTI